MQAMTPEQNEQWRRAINPLDYLDFHALSGEGLREAASRLRQRGVPDRAIQTREWLLSPGEEEMETWKPDFGLRSECALIGAAILSPTRAEALFRRIFVRFAYEALRPFVEWVARHTSV